MNPAHKMTGIDRREEIVGQLRVELRRIQPLLPEQWPSNALFQADLGLDSLDLVELVARIEQQHNRLIDDVDLPCFVSLDAIADYLCARKGA